MTHLGRKQDPDIGLEKSVLAIPPLLAVGAVHHYLIQQGLRIMSYIFFQYIFQYIFIIFHHIFIIFHSPHEDIWVY